MKTWECGHCGRKTRGRRRYCLLWGPVLWRDKKKVRVAVCSTCKKTMGAYV